MVAMYLLVPSLFDSHLGTSNQTLLLCLLDPSVCVSHLGTSNQTLLLCLLDPSVCVSHLGTYVPVIKLCCYAYWILQCVFHIEVPVMSTGTSYQNYHFCWTIYLDVGLVGVNEKKNHCLKVRKKA